MSFFLFIKIFLICLFGAISPGPSMLLVINNALKSKLNGFMSAIGHGLAIGLYALFSVIGLELLTHNYYNIFIILKILSIIFLFYIGMISITKNKKENLLVKDNNVKNYRIAFLEGFTIAILNPKIFIFFTAIYSQFLSLDNNIVLNFTLVSTAMIVDMMWYIILTILVTVLGFKNFFYRRIFLIRKIVGLLFILISVVLMINLLK
ncbi:MAG: LysE family translocator [Alphaproteobacteria bacterium]|jgi:threonine/homoserine/homoserine lactone efflux protein|nr:LysE family translocator [Alphaproteobacteria bacterium]